MNYASFFFAAMSELPEFDELLPLLLKYEILDIKNKHTLHALGEFAADIIPEIYKKKVENDGFLQQYDEYKVYMRVR